MVKETLRGAMSKSPIVGTAVVWAALFSVALSAQVRHAPDGKATVNLMELARRPGGHVAETVEAREVERPHTFRRPGSTASVVRQTVPQPPATPRSRSADAQAAAPAGSIPFSGFPGLLDNFTAIPPDTEGAVGPNDVVTMLNTQVLIQSRAGAARQGFPISLNGFWSPLGNFSDTFDPHILYDAAKDRWLASSAVNGQSNTASSAILVGVSQTGDPGGQWNMWMVNVGTPGGNWGDYPELGFNGSWVVVSVNIFSHAGSYVQTQLYVFDKADLYANGTGASTVFPQNRRDPNFQIGEFTPVLDAGNSTDTLYLMQTFAGDVGYNDGVGTIRISKLTAPLGVNSFSVVGETTVNQPWSDSAPNDADFEPQLGSSTKIAGGDSRLLNCTMQGGTIWCAQNAFLPYPAPTRSAAQWFQIDPASLKVLQFGRVDDPAGTYFYDYPTIAVNSAGDALLGYSRFSANDYPSAAFSFRTSGDPAGTMQQDVIYKRGEAAYVNIGARSGSNRWGDYSATQVDPVDNLSFWTIQEYASTPTGRQSGMFGTWWAEVPAPSAAPACTYSLSPANQLFPTSGGSATAAVTAGSGCPWMAAANVPWISITSGTPGKGSGTIAFNATATLDPLLPRSGTISIAGTTFTVTEGSAAQQPETPVAGIVSAANYHGGAVAPGELVVLFGANFGPPALAKPNILSGGVVDTIAGGVRVLFDGVAAPMVWAQGGTACAVVPFGVQGHATTQVQVQYQGTLSNAVAVPVAAAAPGIFTLDTSGSGPGAIRNPDASVNSAANPAHAGDVVSVYATGGGVIPGVQEGVLATTAQGLDLTNVSVTATVGGAAAQVQYAGVAPTIVVGVMQLNVKIPPGVSGNALPVTISIGGITSPAGPTMAVR
jgi:uncharacterized protein (TIGR03437 family)